MPDDTPRWIIPTDQVGSFLAEVEARLQAEQDEREAVAEYSERTR